MRRREFISWLGTGALALPCLAHAQQRLPVVGFMSGRGPEDSTHLVTSFRDGLKSGGFVEGDNVEVIYRWARGDYARLPALARDLVERNVAVLLGVGGDASALAAKAATSTIPVVFGMGRDPVASGMVASLNRPGGNVTGVNVLTNGLEQKRLGLLNELVPGATTIAALLNPKFLPVADQVAEIEAAARAVRRPVAIVQAGSDADLDAAFDTIVTRSPAALLVGADPFFDTRRDRLVGFTLQRRLPAIFQFREYALAGGLLSYGTSLTDVYRQFGVYTAKILGGARPADLPVQQAVKFEFVINLKTAKQIGFEFPPTFSAQADEVIE
jgi:putative tryptophan/tyrosine transport system substrate-binding protein